MKCNWKHPIFKEIYEEANHCSVISGIPIQDPTPINFAHIKDKARHPDLMYCKDNIRFVTDYEHFLIDHGFTELRNKYVNEMKSKGIYINLELLLK